MKNISFELYKGEILGFYGLRGAGKTEIARAIYGIDETRGSIFINGQETEIKNPRVAIKKKICMVPEERRTQGLVTKLSIRENIPLMNIKKISRYMFTIIWKERDLAKTYIEKLRIATADEDKTVSLLSGGNQQKVVLAKCLNAEGEIMLLDEPTRGIDVGAKQEIYKVIRDFSKEGKSVMVFSSDLPEIINLCDRIILLFDGEIKAVMKNNKEINREEIMLIVTGGKC
ncbi:ATP-binding cassette domain-containing protein [Moorella naiadis]|uniref:ATP-binding cassette domain-containing protein n=1 Tax=Moorella naiadis (nom. illeg.) TaxID=3093670 RepID=UPI003D9C8E05